MRPHFGLVDDIFKIAYENNTLLRAYQMTFRLALPSWSRKVFLVRKLCQDGLNIATTVEHNDMMNDHGWLDSAIVFNCHCFMLLRRINLFTEKEELVKERLRRVT